MCMLFMQMGQVNLYPSPLLKILLLDLLMCEKLIPQACQVAGFVASSTPKANKQKWKCK